MNHGNKFRIKFSISWILYLILAYLIPISKIYAYLFIILSIHELAHIICARCFKMQCDLITIYPFGLSATIKDIDYAMIFRCILVVMAGPLTHLFIPLLLLLLNQMGFISYSFMEYLIMMNRLLLIFNLLPMYPMDGGRILQLLLQLIFPYRKANLYTYRWSIILAILIMIIWFQPMLFIVMSSLLLQNINAINNLNWQCYQFYQYRYDHPYYQHLRYHHHNDLYRGNHNIIKINKGYLKEREWLEFKLQAKVNSVMYHKV